MKKKKFKTKKSIVKRFKITKTGKVLHRGHGCRHLKSKKTKKRIRSLKKMKALKGRFAKKMKLLVGN